MLCRGVLQQCDASMVLSTGQKVSGCWDTHCLCCFVVKMYYDMMRYNSVDVSNARRGLKVIPVTTNLFVVCYRVPNHATYDCCCC
jgi:hypothetical protein